MIPEILTPITGNYPVGEKALEYLTSVLKSETIESIALFQKKQQQTFSDHASDLAALLEAVQAAPSVLRPRQMEDDLIEWFKELGISSSRITQIKGAVRLKRRALSDTSSYSSYEKDVILGLEVEKAYLFGSLTWEGQRKAFNAYRENRKLSLRDLRELNRHHHYDPSEAWKGKTPSGNLVKSHQNSALASHALPPEILDLWVAFQSIIERLVSLEDQWSSSQQIAALVDRASLERLNSAVSKFLPEDDWDF